jgi:hypothetical protein
MAEDHPAGEPGVPILDLAFDSGTLHALRAGVKAHACEAGLPEARAEDVVLVVHELAANAVSHGAGAGRLRIWKPGRLVALPGRGWRTSAPAPVMSRWLPAASAAGSPG